MIPILPAQHAIKYTPQVVQIYQYDGSPIDGRKPLLLVHGLKDEYVRRLHWEKVCKFLNANPDFRKRYKIFLARYNSLAREEETADAFRPALREFADSQHQMIFVVALSISGDIVRDAMGDPAVEKSVSKVITLGTPFHGSPLFNKDWMIYSSFKHHKSLIIKLDRYLAYSVYFKYHKNLLKDYYWDNYDSEVPDIGHYKFKLPILVEGNLVPPAKPPGGASWERNGEKFIAYGGYFQDRYIEKMNHSRLFTIIHAPFSFFYTTVPAHLGNEHAALRLLNYEIAFLDPKHKQRYPSFFYNDGVAPVSSTLSLVPEVLQTAGNEIHTLKNSEQQTQKIAFALNKNGKAADPNDPPDDPPPKDPPSAPLVPKLQSTAHKARLFPDIDHISFLDGYRPIASPRNLPDQLSPSEKPRPILDWLLSDILNGG